MKKLIIEKKDLENNLKIINSKKDRNTKIIAVVKANGMGLDLLKYSKFLIYRGIKILAVSEPDDAIFLRKNKIKCKILLLTPINKKEILERLIKNNIIITIADLEGLNIVKQISKEIEMPVTVHLKIDTGFGRYGTLYSNYEYILKIFKEKENINIEGIYTHFSKAIDEKYTTIQFERFTEIIKKLEEDGFKINIKHCSNSTAFIKYPQMQLNAVRLGSIIQGRTLVKVEGLKKVGFFETNISQIKTLPIGYNIGYSNTYKLKRNSKIAVIPVGHADGFETKNKRDNFNFKENIKAILIEVKNMLTKPNAKVIINDKKYNIIGRIGLNYSDIDITDSNITTKDKVILDVNPLQVNGRIRREYR